MHQSRGTRGGITGTNCAADAGGGRSPRPAPTMCLASLWLGWATQPRKKTKLHRPSVLPTHLCVPCRSPPEGLPQRALPCTHTHTAPSFFPQSVRCYRPSGRPTHPPSPFRGIIYLFATPIFVCIFLQPTCSNAPCAAISCGRCCTPFTYSPSMEETK